ncbi:sulfate ABC transporter ATP-binding protein [Vibrio sp. V27_P1S3P104]|uniref:sulfate/molybdate ABC transporter ATP-binding protein n=1 Tax=unclassified Vibrio TaxID=2614977 RepID=UPI0013732805|nr:MULTISPECIES: TOBE-like domain-containing protein [unclassified Vibrio]NAW69534.1 sulfate ABC transporter ATP-binding protein [Vibrio sp. V28_P6S34P95]NAX05355.1 sulfate ABC transporter ATP-binding protein [Vibrio sp. V30_P3S12P165]NAX33843.1 sulfate ABC transporter ATP-binding protein [Vibrio sp. V29_P1S30P107]NAX37044.1 sulfate ABC transporter ATP-binding protein [Vibrio sp. V27_P1S3P104]NAX39753.1 sulfate ABC transporter ATP-binding protein [Vibrio sp. V26_P1S5P106]
MSIRLDNICKNFGQFQAISPLSLHIDDGEMVGLLGPSGSGKTTLLRIIAGLEGADSGTIHFGNRNVTNVHVRERRVGFVFQNYALFRHMTVADNVAFGLQVMERRKRPPAAVIAQRVKQLLDIVQLGHLAERYPEQLSGGQKQRIALARALATQPEVLLLDEPFGALDAKVRKELRRWLRNLHDELSFTSVFVTHDQDEALELSDRVVVMSDGRIEQIDSPVQLYAQPNSRFVFDFFGNVNVFQAEWQHEQWANGQAFILPPKQQAICHSGKLYVRSHELTLSRKPNSQASLPFEVISINPVGAEVRVELAPLGWQSNDHWEAKLTHRALSEQPLTRGDHTFATPQVGYFFGEQQSTPHVIRWPFLDADSLMFEI